MDTTTAQALIALNNRFYRDNAASFSATRSAPWEGWKQARKHIARAWLGGCDGASDAPRVRYGKRQPAV